MFTLVMAKTPHRSTVQQYEGGIDELVKTVIRFELLDQPIRYLKGSGDEFEFVINHFSYIPYTCFTDHGIHWAIWPGEMAKFILENLVHKMEKNS